MAGWWSRSHSPYCASPTVSSSHSSALIAAYGWRRSFAILGLLAIFTIVSCAAFIVRDPETMGLDPDGQAPLPSHDVPDNSFSDDWTLAEARRTSAFWLLNAIFALT